MKHVHATKPSPVARPWPAVRAALLMVLALLVVLLPAAAARAQQLKPVPGAYIVTLKEGAPAARVLSTATTAGAQVRHTTLLEGRRLSVREMTPAAAAALAALPEVEEVIPDAEAHIMLVQSIPLVGALTGSNALRNSDGGLGVTVCVLDTGINRFHTMFDDDNDIETPTGKIKAWKDFVNGEVVPYDDHGHGTHLAGTIFGRDGILLGGLPLQGMAPRGRIYIGKVLGQGGFGLFSDIQAGIEWCAGMAPDSPVPRADIINLSLGAGFFPHVCDADPSGTAVVVNAAAAAGVLVVAASGNELNFNGVATPACASGAMAVGATHDESLGPLVFNTCSEPLTAVDRLACFSNRWDFLDVVAPGCLTHSASSVTGFLIVPDCGTSMAAAHVSGLAALVKGANRQFTAAEIRQRINSTAVDLGAPGFDRAHGNGRIDAGKAVDGDNCFPFESSESTCGDGIDNDCDDRVDCADPDCCGLAPCTLPDSDGDGVGVCDCDDGNFLAWEPPGEVPNLLLQHDPGSGTTALAWETPALAGGTSLTYDVLGAATPGAFFDVSACLESGGLDLAAVDGGVPAPGSATFYLVRAANGCAGGGSMGTDTDGVARVARSCP